MDHGTLYIILACLFGFIMTWGVGANDLANVMSTTMGSKSLTMRQVFIIAIIFEFAGAYIGGEQVSDTLRDGILNPAMLAPTPEIFVYGMLAVLLAGSTWMAIASILGLPVSITHTIIGAIVGFGVIQLGLNGVQWQPVMMIALSWIISPLLAGLLAFIMLMSIQRMIFMKPNPTFYAKRYAPLYLFLIGIAFAMASVVRGLAHRDIHLSRMLWLDITLSIGLLTMFIGMLCIRRLAISDKPSRHVQFANAEKIFSTLMIFTACAMIFAHGSNDIAIAVGPMAAIIGVVQSGGEVEFSNTIHPAITFLGCAGVVIGFIMYGRNVIATVGNRITGLTPSRAFAATLSAAFTVVLATGTGIPVSATQTLVGGILGVGLARGIGALNMTVVRNIFMSWMITIPAGALFAMAYFNILKWLVIKL